VAAAALLGYLNFSDGRADPRWEKQLNDTYAFFGDQGAERPWDDLLDWLRANLRQLQESGGAAFRDSRQAQIVLERAAMVLPAYRAHHADLLAHLDDRDLFTPFFLARVFEAVLTQGVTTADGEWLPALLTRFNDFVGHRPIAILETRPQGEPYDHERIRPVPLFIRGAGTAWGRYHGLVSRALEILAETDSDLRTEAQLDLDLLDEFALDVRAYDHAHPVNRRPNYVFGEWDPHHLDNQGRYRRYVARQLILDSLLDRVNQPGELPREERLFEAAAVLAGTILMSTGISGSSPMAHDSTINLANLLPRIARSRDLFYERLLKRLSGPHAERLRQEQATTRQPFGGVRQHINAFLARHRAMQLQHRCLSLLFAEMGFARASRAEARRIPSASMRLLSEVLARLASGALLAEQAKTAEAARFLPELENLLQRGIACGAFADPWNILGFQGLFPLSSAREDSVRDVRLDELVQMVEMTFNLYLHLLTEAAAVGDDAMLRELNAGLRRLAAWWDPYATADVSDVRRVHGGESATAGAAVSEALTRWHERGEGPADLAFWRQHLDRLTTPKAFALVVDTLLRKGDFRASMALLTSWLGRAEQVPLEETPPNFSGGGRMPHKEGTYSFHNLALNWMLEITSPRRFREGGLSPEQRRDLIVKFFDHLEANAEEFWQVPSLDLVQPEEEDSPEEDLYEAAYEKFVYEDSTDDEEGAVSDGGPVEEFDLEAEGERLDKRLRFHSTLSRLWRIAARYLRSGGQGGSLPEGWLTTARANRQRLLSLLDALHDHPLPDPSGDYDSLVEYDRRRVLKEQLLFTTIGTCLDTTLAVDALTEPPTGGPPPAKPATGPETLPMPRAVDDWATPMAQLERALFQVDVAGARRLLPEFLESFQSESLLVTPFMEGGTPRQVLRVRVAQTVLRELLANLPRLGLVRETYETLRAARSMEQARPAQGRGVTEFNHFFQTAFQEAIESIVLASEEWTGEEATDESLVAMLERLTTPFLTLWIEHSRSLQLSVLETLSGETEWNGLRAFVRKYGHDLFHARFMTLGNLRGILHRGVGNYLDYLQDNPDPLHPVHLFDDLDRTIRREDAVKRLEVVLQAVIENYEEFKDYNTTTTQSDYGENLHVLLDFLRLKVGYERHAWQFRPLMLAHEVLARRGREQAALLWERSITQLTGNLARQHLDQLAKLEQTHGIRLGTVTDRLQERFIKPLALDRLCALIEPCVKEADQGEDAPAFQKLRSELEAFTSAPVGVGLDVPAWLRRLDMELQRAKAMNTSIGTLAENFFRVPRRSLSFEEVQQQLREWERPALPGGAS
jgi:hypothetical protein